MLAIRNASVESLPLCFTHFKTPGDHVEPVHDHKQAVATTKKTKDCEMMIVIAKSTPRSTLHTRTLLAHKPSSPRPPTHLPPVKHTTAGTSTAPSIHTQGSFTWGRQGSRMGGSWKENWKENWTTWWSLSIKIHGWIDGDGGHRRSTHNYKLFTCASPLPRDHSPATPHALQPVTPETAGPPISHKQRRVHKE